MLRVDDFAFFLKFQICYQINSEDPDLLRILQNKVLLALFGMAKL